MLRPPYIDAARTIYRRYAPPTIYIRRYTTDILKHPTTEYIYLFNQFIMNQLSINTLHTCRYCLQALPPEDFYINNRTHQPECYCKKCRSQIAHMRYFRSHHVDKVRHYPIITDTPDRNQRLALIRHARQVVNDSIARKRRILRESGLDTQ